MEVLFVMVGFVYVFDEWGGVVNGNGCFKVCIVL